jgi:hemolysin activation/secretion protein
MVQRSQRVKTSLTLRIAQNNGRSFVDDTEVDVQRRSASYGELLLKRDATQGRSTYSVALGMRAGLRLFGTLPDVQGADAAPTSLYGMTTLEASAAVPFRIGGLSLRWLPQLRGQLTGDRLYLTDDFSIGNRYTVRGFDGTTALAAENGYYFRNDVELPLRRSRTAFYVGLDTGHVWGPNASNLAGQSLTGLALGVRGGTARTNVDAFTGFALANPAGFRTSRTAGGIDVTYQL